MGKIFYIMGKSATGKDTLFHLLTQDKELKLKTVIMYTTRPIRSGEEEGREYFFRDKSFLERMLAEGKVIESRTYQTIHGPWSYFTVNDGQIDLEENDYLMIGTLESYQKTREYYGIRNIIPLYIYIDDGERLSRALNRERLQKQPKYAEMCRRFLADEEDFSCDKIKNCGITRYYENDQLDKCYETIKRAIQSQYPQNSPR